MDSARTYCGGTSEEYLGKIDWKKRGLELETKLYPNIVRQSCKISDTEVYLTDVFP